MSEDEDSKKFINNIGAGKSGIVEFDDAVEFFKQRASTLCPICAHTKWTVYATDGSDNGRYTIGLVGVSVPSKKIIPAGMPLVTVTCGKCAFVRLHNAADISKWVAEGKREFEDEE
jgi:hypothetical protein